MGEVTDDLERLYADSDALGLADLVRRREVPAIELVETAIALIERLDPQLNAVVIRTFDMARAAATDPGAGPFAGVPFLLKNLGSMWKGTPLTAGLGYLKGHVCDSDSEMSRRMRASGLALLGRSNTPEFGWSITTEPRLYGATINPWNPAITAGGLSGGSAAAGRRALCADRRGVGWRRFDPGSGLLLRGGRPQAVARAHHLWSGRRCLVRQHLRALPQPHGARHRRLPRRGRRHDGGRRLQSSSARPELAGDAGRSVRPGGCALASR